jgi:hypothetical protein
MSSSSTTIDITISFAEGDSVLPFQVEADETVENLKALIEAMVRSTAKQLCRRCLGNWILPFVPPHYIRVFNRLRIHSRSNRLLSFYN